MFRPGALLRRPRRDAGLEAAGLGRQGWNGPAASVVALVGHISRGHEEVAGSTAKARNGPYIFGGHGAWASLHSRRAAGARSLWQGALGSRKDGVVDFWPGFLPSGAWPKTGGGGGALGSCGRACWLVGVTGVTPQVVEDVVYVTVLNTHEASAIDQHIPVGLEALTSCDSKLAVVPFPYSLVMLPPCVLVHRVVFGLVQDGLEVFAPAWA